MSIKVPYFIKTSKKGKEPKTNFAKARIEKIKKEFNELRYKFYKLKIKRFEKIFTK